MKPSIEVTELLMEGVDAGNSPTGRDELYLVCNGLRIAKRGYPDTPQARIWFALEPGWEVREGGSKRKPYIEIRYLGAVVH
jgi:hypothetical protein